jgi:hypothetical protein
VLLDLSGQTGPKTLAQIPERLLSRPTWSPDGRQIAVSVRVDRPYRD